MPMLGSGVIILANEQVILLDLISLCINNEEMA